MTQLKDSILQQAEDKVEAQLTPETRDNYMKIVVAGMHIAMDKGPDGMLGQYKKNSKDPIDGAAKGAIGLVLGMQKQAKGIMPNKAMIPAGMTLMLKCLDFAESAGMVKIDNDAVVRATKIFADTWMRVFHVTPAMFNHAVGKVNKLAADPQAVEKMKLAAGVTQHPMAAKPTPLPDGGGLINGAA